MRAEQRKTYGVTALMQTLCSHDIHTISMDCASAGAGYCFFLTGRSGIMCLHVRGCAPYVFVDDYECVRSKGQGGQGGEGGEEGKGGVR